MDERFHEALWGAIVGLFPADAAMVEANHNWIVIRWHRSHGGRRMDEYARPVAILAEEHVADTIDDAPDYQVARLVRSAERVVSRRMAGYRDDVGEAFQIRLDDEVLNRAA